MGIVRNPLSLSRKSKKITRLSPTDYDQYLMAACSAGEVTPDADGWKTLLDRGARPRIVNKIMDILKRRVAFSGLEGVYQLETMATSFEERIYAVATSQSDYLRRLSLKMLRVESQNSMHLPSNNSGNSISFPASGHDIKENSVPLPSINAGNRISFPASGHDFKVNRVPLSSIDAGNRNSFPASGHDIKVKSVPLPSVNAGNSNGFPDIVRGAGDWKTKLAPGSRQRIVNKIMDTLERHVTLSSPEGLYELAARFEENTYAAATSQSDYLRKLSLQMLTLESKSRNSMPLPSNNAGNSIKYPASGHDIKENSVPLLSINAGNSNSFPDSAGEASMDAGDWKSKLLPDFRQQIVNKIMGTLKRHLPFSGPKGLFELGKIAARFEEKIYATATSQSDYLRKTSLKMLSEEPKSEAACLVLYHLTMLGHRERLPSSG